MRRASLLSTGIAAVALTASCQLVVDRSGFQCTSTEECRARGGESFSRSICSSEGFCELIVAPDAAPALGSPCSASSDCRDRLQQEARCIDSACQPLLLEDGSCTPLGSITNDDAVLLGALIPENGAAGGEFARSREILRWVTAEWNARAPEQGARPVAMVVCDESRLSTTLPHLLTLKPRAMIGPFTNARFREYNKQSNAIKLPTFAPSVDDPLLVEQPDSQRHVYACRPNLSGAVGAFRRAASVLAKKVAQERSIDAAKVVLAITDDPADAAFAAKVKEGLVLEGATAEKTATLVVQTISFDPHAQGAAFVAQAQVLAREKPDLVLLTSSLLTSDFASALDFRWSALHGSAPLPLMLTMGRTSSFEETLHKAGKSTAGRFYAVDWQPEPGTESNYNVYVGEMLARGAPTGFNAARTVDCTMAALYGMFAGAAQAKGSMLTVSEQQTIDGVAIATAGSERIDLVPSAIPRALGLLGVSPPQSTALVSVGGASMVFQTNGTVPGSAGLYCISSESASPSRTWTPTGLTFASTGEENGVIACP